VSESVWDYPRPPRLEPVEARLRVLHRGVSVADTVRGHRVLETSHPPTYYVPPEDIETALLSPARGASFCEFKGVAQYWDLTVAGVTVPRVAWSYPEAGGAYAAIAGHLAFYASLVDEAWVGDMRAVAQEGDFYGGWITPDVTGPFKGAPGTRHW